MLEEGNIEKLLPSALTSAFSCLLLGGCVVLLVVARLVLCSGMAAGGPVLGGLSIYFSS